MMQETTQVRTTFPITRLSTVLNYLLAAVILTAMLAGGAIVLYVLSPSPVVLLIPPVSFFVILEAMSTTRWLREPEHRDVNRILYRITELVVIILAMRLFTFALDGTLPDWETLRGYLLSPLSFVDVRFAGFVFFALIAWERGVAFGNIIGDLALSPDEVSYYSLPPYQRSIRAEDRPMDPQRLTQFNSLISNWVIGGIVLSICAAITTVSLPELAGEEVVALRNITRLGLRPEMLVSLIIYFIGGLWLISRMRLVTLRTRWIMDNIQVQTGLQRVWNWASLALIVIVAFLAAFLPVGSSLGAARILNAILAFLLLVVNLFLALISLIIYFFVTLLGAGERPPPELELAPPAPTPTPTPPPGSANETIALVFGSFFWVIIIAISLIAVVFFLRGRGVQIDFSLLQDWWTRFQAWLRWFWRGASAQVAALGETLVVRRRKGDVEAESSSPWRFIRVNALSARDQIRYFYLSTVRRAGEQGVERPGSATPSEYADRLKRTWPEAEKDIEGLTDAFLHARYSPKEVEEEEAGLAKTTWKRVRGRLRRRRHAPDDDEAEGAEE